MSNTMTQLINKMSMNQLKTFEKAVLEIDNPNPLLRIIKKRRNFLMTKKGIIASAFSVKKIDGGKVVRIRKI